MNTANAAARHPLACGVIEYIAHNPVGGPQVRVDFAGRFAGHPVIWCATIVALGRGAAKQYIDVQTIGGSQRPEDLLQVEIGLPLNTIHEPDVLKTIIMMRQYKNLGPGKHEFAGAAK
jgi:hypothetical protein